VKKFLFCLMLAVLPAVCARGEGVPAKVAPVTLYTDFQQAVPQAAMEALRDEVDSIMSPLGLRFDWHALSDFRSERVSAAVAVAHFEGHCDVTGLVMRENQPGPLGWTEISDGRILPFTHVDCERVRTFLQTTLLGFHPQDRERALGRALGRVLAHELYHVYADTSQHASRGAGKEEYSVADLLAPNFQFHDRQARALRGGKTLAALKASGGPL
jgi:hypothetical protein